MNEVGTLFKYIRATAIADTEWQAIAGNKFYPEVVPENTNLKEPVGMVVSIDHRDTQGAFGFRLFCKSLVQIKAVVEGTSFSPIWDCADIIDRLFDWQNQIDVAAGRPKAQEMYTDPDKSSKKIIIMSMVRNSQIRSTSFVANTNYCNLGGIYEIEYYAI